MDPAIPFEKIAAQAIFQGASLIGAADVAALLDSPSHRRYPTDPRVRDACSVVVLALSHPGAKPKMDWWSNRKGKTPGNRLLLKISRGLTSWFRKAHSAEARSLPYHVNQGGVFLKDAAVLSGLGVIGKNNLLITPQYGPRVRLRALLVNRTVQGTAPLDGFAPCDGCDAPCMQVCPREAFRSGFYQVERCQLQLKKDETRKIVIRQPVIGMPVKFKVSYCRLCELTCPVGRETDQFGSSPQT
jgi:epoxyqueuosine reductase